MSKLIDLTGKRFGKLIVIKRVEDYVTPKGHHRPQWLCRCDCGAETIVQGQHLRNGSIKSCGCYNKEIHKKSNEWFIDLNTATAIGTDCNGKKFIIDAEDWLKVKDYCWRINNEGYVRTQVNGKCIGLHRFLMNFPDDMLIDHINGDTANNCKSNLRIVTDQQNAMNRKKQSNNSSGCSGVSWKKSRDKWVARIMYKGKIINLGSFTNKEDAIKVRQEAEIKYFGEFKREEQTVC